MNTSPIHLVIVQTQCLSHACIDPLNDFMCELGACIQCWMCSVSLVCITCFDAAGVLGTALSSAAFSKASISERSAILPFSTIVLQ